MLQTMMRAAAGAMLAGAAAADTLEAVQARGALSCGVSNGAPGFSFLDAGGNWSGFDVAFCRAVAAAVFGEADRVSYTPTAGAERFDALASGAVDLLARNTTWTFTRDVGMGFEFAGVNYFDGQGFLVRRSAGLLSAGDLAGQPVCVTADTTTAENLVDHFAAVGAELIAVAAQDNADAQARYLAGDCVAITADVSALAATRAGFEAPRDHLILRDVISKEPLGPLVRRGDPRWADIVRWTLFALIAAEELGLSSANVTDPAAARTAEARRLLGHEGDFGAMLGLRRDWALQAIAQVGNYGEIFDRTIGENTAIGLSRGLNASYARGGILYAPPFH